MMRGNNLIREEDCWLFSPGEIVVCLPASVTSHITQKRVTFLQGREGMPGKETLVN